MRSRRRCGLGWFDLARSGTAGSTAGKRKQGDVARPLDGHAEPALVTRTDAGHAARKNFAAFLHELGKNVGALVVDQIDLFDTELADFLLAEKLALASARSAGTTTGAAWPSRATFTASTARTAFATATAAVTCVSSAWTAFAARRGGRGRSLRSCWYWILFI